MRIGAPFYTTILFFVVQAEVFHGIIVASHSCTEYHWGTLMALYVRHIKIPPFRRDIISVARKKNTFIVP